MSIKLMAAAWELDIPSTEKMVLLCLCDYSNDVGVCWPSVPTIARKCSKGERTIQGAIQWLRDNDYCSWDDTPGRPHKFTLNPRKICAPAEIAPPQVLHKPPQKLRPTPAEVAPEPSITIKEPPINNTTRTKVAKPDGVEQDIWNDFLDHRKAKRAPLSNTALAAVVREAARAGWCLNDALAEIVARNWQTFKAEWVKENGNNGRNQNNTSRNGKPIDGFVAALRHVENRPIDEPFGNVGSRM